ncbi:MAG: GntG family PLP-dependent aldolase [Chitinophagales bacterium]
MIIDLRSDTVTRPTPDMLHAMMHAKVGDDVFEEDPTIEQLQQKAAKLFGMEAALFCPSGTMANQIAIKLHTQPLEQVICHELSHIYNYEIGGHAFLSGVSLRLLRGKRGIFTPEDVVPHIMPDYDWYAKTSLLWLENTCNKGGGSYFQLAELQALRAFCKEKKLKQHIDGARIFNGLVAANIPPQQIGNLTDSISVCLSKGLGTPVGSLIIGSKKDIKRARKIRKVLGGGMRQAGYLAAAGIYALDHNIERMKEDHENAQKLGQVLSQQSYVASVTPADTNILLFEVAKPFTAQQLVAKLAEYNILAFPNNDTQIRFVTHLDFTAKMLDFTIDVLQKIDLKQNANQAIIPVPKQKQEPNILFGRYSDAHKSEEQMQYWEQAEQYFEQKEYLKSYRQLLLFMTDKTQQNLSFTEHENAIDFELIQGSKKITGRLTTEKILAITHIAKASRLNVRLMRQLMETNHKLHYSSFALHEDLIVLRFTSSILDGSPEKIYVALKELSVMADKQDDLLLHDFSDLQAVEKVAVRHLTTQEQEVKIKYLRLWITDILNRIKLLDANTDAKSASYLLLYLAYKIDYLLVPQSKIANKIEKIQLLYFINDGNSTVEKNARMQQQYEQMLEMSDTAIADEIYQVKATFGMTNTTMPDDAVTFISDLLPDFLAYRQAKKDDMADIVLQYIVLYSLYHHGIPSFLKDFYHLLVELQQHHFFAALGYQPLYNIEKKKLNKKLIHKKLQHIQNAAQEIYQDFSISFSKIEYNTITSFSRTLLQQLKNANYNKARK